MLALEEEKRILEERQKLKESGVIESTSVAIDGATSTVGSSVAGGVGMVSSGISGGVGLVGSGLGAGVSMMGSGFGAMERGLTKAGKFMGRSITGQSGSSKKSGSSPSTPINTTQQ